MRSASKAVWCVVDDPARAHISQSLGLAAHVLLCNGDAPGLEVSPRDVLKDMFVRLSPGTSRFSFAFSCSSSTNRFVESPKIQALHILKKRLAPRLRKMPEYQTMRFILSLLRSIESRNSALLLL